MKMLRDLRGGPVELQYVEGSERVLRGEMTLSEEQYAPQCRIGTCGIPK